MTVEQAKILLNELIFSLPPVVDLPHLRAIALAITVLENLSSEHVDMIDQVWSHPLIQRTAFVSNS